MKSSSLLIAAFAAASVLACAHHRPASSAQPTTAVVTPPPDVLGTFLDDYGGSHDVSANTWIHDQKISYQIVKWVPERQYLIAQNAASNKRGGGLWTRIDWMRFEGMAPYTWGFCLSAYDARTREAAEAVTIATRETPRTGCNGFPFTRLRRR